MVEDGVLVLLLSTWTSFTSVFLIKGSQTWGTGMMLLLWHREEVLARLGEKKEMKASLITLDESLHGSLWRLKRAVLFCWVCKMREMKGGIFFLYSAESRLLAWVEREKGWVKSCFWKPGKKKRKGMRKGAATSVGFATPSSLLFYVFLFYGFW